MPTPKLKCQSRSRPNNSKAGRNRATRATARKTATHRATIKSVLAQPHRLAGSKQARIIAMLRTPSGATLAAMVQATGWQQHSVRGFLAGVIRKKLGLHLGSEPSENGRIYRITERTASTAVSAAG